MTDCEKYEECKNWLREVLSEGEKEYSSVKESAARKGFSRFLLKKARKELGVKTFHQAIPEEGTENWFWFIEEA